MSTPSATTGIRIGDLMPNAPAVVDEIAHILVAAFAHIPGCLKTLDAARAEIRESFAPGRISRVALDAEGHALGWIGAIEAYHGHAWELHPLAVRPDVERPGNRAHAGRRS